MATMKYPNVSGGTNMAVSGNGSHVDEVDSLFSSSCWPSSNISLQNDFIDTHSLSLENSINNLGADKLLLDSPISQDCESEIETDALDKLFLSSQPTNTSLAELKPLPPFVGYTANLSINGIQGHHYHTISQRIPEDNNNNYNNYNEQNIVSSSTCNVSADSAGDCVKTIYSVDDVVKLGYADCANPDSVSSAKIYDNCNQQQTAADSVTQHIKTEIGEYDISIDFANIIGSAIGSADTTVPNNNTQCDDDPTGSKDSWMDFDVLIDEACGEQPKNLIITQDSLSEFVIPCSNSEYNQKQQQQQQQNIEYTNKIQQQQGSSTLQTLLTHGYVPLLHNRLQNGPSIKQETPSSTNYGNELITTSSPPANVVSTTDNLLLTVNGRFMPQYNVHSMNDERIRSPEMIGQNYPHTTTTTTPTAPKKSRCRGQKKQQQQQQQPASSTVFPSEQNLGLLGKEKPVHRCSICNRGFLNKSNIKVHLRTHTGEKPFRCDTCAKAFRQKAHLLKHQQIHKRIGRD